MQSYDCSSSTCSRSSGSRNRCAVVAAATAAAVAVAAATAAAASAEIAVAGAKVAVANTVITSRKLDGECCHHHADLRLLHGVSMCPCRLETFEPKQISSVGRPVNAVARDFGRDAAAGAFPWSRGGVDSDASARSLG